MTVCTHAADGPSIDETANFVADFLRWLSIPVCVQLATQAAAQLRQSLPALWVLLSENLFDRSQARSGANRAGLMAAEAVAAHCNLFTATAEPVPMQHVLAAADISYQRRQQDGHSLLIEEPDSPFRHKRRKQKSAKKHKHKQKHKRQKLDAFAGALGSETSEALEHCVWTIGDASQTQWLTKELQQALIQYMFCTWTAVNI